MAAPLKQEDRRAAWDAGITSAADHHLRGAPRHSPFATNSRRHAYWRRAFQHASAALLSVMEQRP